MIDLDRQIRRGLADAAETVPEVTSTELAERLGRAVAGQQRRHRRLALAVAAVIVVVGGLTALLVWPDGDPAESLRTGTTTSTTPPTPSQGFAALAPGWHRLDTGAVPPMYGASMAWTGTDLVVAGQADQGTQVWAMRPDEEVPGAGSGRPWRKLDGFPIDDAAGLGLVWADGKLLAVEGSFPAARAAVYTPSTKSWALIDHPPAAPALVRAGQGLLDADRSKPALLWTGQRVLDLTHGAAWDPSDGSWTPMAMPGTDLLAYSQLASANPVWTGHEVVAVAWTAEPGLAWNATGSSVREIAGPTALDGVDPGVVGSAVATRAGDGVLLAVGSEEGWTVRQDASGTWQVGPRVPGMTTPEGCPRGAATVGDRPVVIPCDGTAPVYLDGAAWKSTGEFPYEMTCCMTRWLDAGGVLVSWETDRDLYNGRQEEYLQAAVWVPPR